MFYEVRIKKPDGTLKRVVSKEQVAKDYWDNFEKSEGNIGLVTAPKAQAPRWVKQALDLIFPDGHESRYTH